MMRQFFSFGVVGGLSTAAQYVILIMLVQLMGIGAVPASAAGYALSSVLNYTLNYRYTFRSRRAHHQAFPRFAFISMTGLAINAGCMAIGVHYLGLYYLIAQVLATGITLLWNFAANRLWTFREPEQAAVTLTRRP